MKLIFLFLVLLFSSTTLASEKIYKWVDASGQTHYTTKKPEDQQSQEMNIRIPKSQPSASKQESDTQDAKPSSERFDEYRKSREENKTKTSAHKKKCTKAKATLNRFKEQVRFAQITADGKKHYLEDSQRKEILNAANKAIKKYCR